MIPETRPKRLRGQRDWSVGRGPGRRVGSKPKRSWGALIRRIVVGAVIVVVSMGLWVIKHRKTAEQLLESGNRYAAQHKYGEAVIEYLSALKKNPSMNEARYRLADTYVKTNDLSNALSQYIQAADVAPADSQAQSKAAEFLLFARQFEAAMAYAEKVLAKDAKNVTARVVKSNSMAGLNDVPGAMKLLEEMTANESGDARPFTSLAMLKAANGKPEEAESLLVHSVQVDPRSVGAHLALANFYLYYGRVLEAESPLKRAVSLEPGNIVAQRLLLDFCEATGRGIEAGAPLKALAAISEDVPSRLALADFQLSQGRNDEAAALLKEIANERDGYGGATVRLATLDYAQQRIVEAHRKVDEVLAKQGKNPEALLTKARFLVAEKKVDEALPLAKAAVAFEQGMPEAYYLLGAIHASRNELDEAINAFGEALALKPGAVDARIHLAELDAQNGEAGTSVRLAEEAVESSPSNPVARLVLVRALESAGEVGRAEAELRRLLAEYPDATQAHVQMGRLQIAKQDKSGTTRTFDRVRELKLLDEIRARVSGYLKAGNVKQAVATAEERLSAAPNDTAVIMLAASVYLAAGDSPRAEVALGRIVELDSTNLAAFTTLASIYVRQGKLDVARAKYEALSRQQSQSVIGPTMLALIAEAQNKGGEARRWYKKVLAAAPNAPVAANNLAWLYAEEGVNLDTALKLAYIAQGQLFEMPEVNDTLGWVYYKKHLASLAIPQFESSVQKQPDNPVFQYHLGLAYGQIGENAKAKQAFDEALRRKPDYREADEARRSLAQLASSGRRTS